MYPYLLEIMGAAQVCLFHGFVCLGASAFIACCIPETKGLTNYQITHLFARSEFRLPTLVSDLEKEEAAATVAPMVAVAGEESSADALISEGTTYSTEVETDEDTLTQDSV